MDHNSEANILKDMKTKIILEFPTNFSDFFSLKSDDWNSDTSRQDTFHSGFK